MSKVCVFLSSRWEDSPLFLSEIKKLGDWILKNNHTLVYGGSSEGLIKILAHHVLDEGGEVIGIVPDSSDVSGEIPDPRVMNRITVTTMPERKQKMLETSDIFITFPGGLGSMDEFFEIAARLPYLKSNKRNILWNLDGYYDGIISFLDTAKHHGCITDENMKFIEVIRGIEELF